MSPFASQMPHLMPKQETYIHSYAFDICRCGEMMKLHFPSCVPMCVSILPRSTCDFFLFLDPPKHTSVFLCIHLTFLQGERLQKSLFPSRVSSYELQQAGSCFPKTFAAENDSLSRRFLNRNEWMQFSFLFSSQINYLLFAN